MMWLVSYSNNKTVLIYVQYSIPIYNKNWLGNAWFGMGRGGHRLGGSGLGLFFHPTQLSWVWRDDIRWPSIEVVGLDGSGDRVQAGDRVYNTTQQKQNQHLSVQKKKF